MLHHLDEERVLSNTHSAIICQKKKKNEEATTLKEQSVGESSAIYSTGGEGTILASLCSIVITTFWKH